MSDRSGKEVDEGTKSPDPFRRGLLGAAVAAPAILGALLKDATHAGEIPRPAVAHILDDPEALADGNPLERMRAELRTALEKPMSQRRWVMVIDLTKCVGCFACTVSCVAENSLPPGVVYRPVVEEEVGTYPHVRRRFVPRPCMHCDNPPCVPPCPVGATYKRSDGIVVIDYDQCIGCRYCITACPYAARTFDFGGYYGNGTPQVMAYETRPSPEYGENRDRPVNDEEKSPKGNVRKCHFCAHRLENGMLPACVTTCLGGATYFGDANDPTSLVSQLIGTTRVMRLREELRTEPKVYYLV